jgi:hypothetical protein
MELLITNQWTHQPMESEFFDATESKSYNGNLNLNVVRDLINGKKYV